MGDGIVVISEDIVMKYLKNDSLYSLVEKVLGDVSRDAVVQPARIIMPAPPDGVLLTMPGFLKDDKTLGCKIVTYFRGNPSRGLQTILGNIFLYNGTTGQLEAVVGGTEITGWRTAMASAVGTRHLHKGEKNILTILGAGTQGRTHALAFQSLFNFKQVRIWNRTYQRAVDLVKSISKDGVFVACKSNEEAVRDADVICTVTASPEPVVKYEWLKPGVQINAVGAGIVHYSELDIETYKHCLLITDSSISAKSELAGLEKDHNISPWGEIGQIINGKELPKSDITVFQPLGMAAEDIILAKHVFEKFKSDSCKNKN